MGGDTKSLIDRVIALAVANVRSGRGGPFAALVVQDGRVIAEGVNLVTTENDPTAHAEVVAIRAACRALGNFRLEGCDVYASCEPCPMCLGAIYWARPANVYYAATAADASNAGFDDSFIYRQIGLAHSERAIPMTALVTHNALRPFEVWRAQAGKKPY